MFGQQKKPYTYTVDKFVNVTNILKNQEVESYDLNTIVFRHPKIKNSVDRNDDQPQDIRKLSIRTMSDYILNFGLTNEDLNVEPITASKDKTFNTIYAINESSSDVNRPATFKDLIDLLKNTVLNEVFDDLLTHIDKFEISGTTAFDPINTIYPKTILSLDPFLTTDKLFNLTNEQYIEEFFDNFLYVGNSNYVNENEDGFLDPKETEILINHKHNNVLYEDSKATKNAIRVTVAGKIGKSTEAGSMAMMLNEKSTYPKETDDWNNRDLSANHLNNKLIGYHKKDDNEVVSKIFEKTESDGKTLTIGGDPENDIQLNNVKAQCKPNKNSQSKNYISELDKVSVRYKARHYRIFRKEDSDSSVEDV